MGRQIDKIVFNPNVSIEQMTSYLASLDYGLGMTDLVEINGKGDITIDESVTYSYDSPVTRITAIDLASVGQSYGVEASGYAICEIPSGQTSAKKVIFISEYSDNNLAFLQSLGVTDLNYNADNYGWIDTSDLLLDEYKTGYVDDVAVPLTLTISMVYDNKVSEFIGVEDKFWE